MGQELRTAENVLATIGAVLWSILPIPQIIKTFRLKSTEGLSGNLMLIWAIGALFISAYAIVQELSLALQIEPHVFGVLGAVSWAQCLYYSSGYSKYGSLGAFIVFVVLFGFIETTSIFTMLYSKLYGIRVPILLYGYTSSVLTILGFLPQYIEIYRRKQVMGISNIFLWIGIMGGIFMFASLICREKLDIAAGVVYLSTSALNVGIFVLAHILNPRANKRDAAESGLAANLPGIEAVGEKPKHVDAGDTSFSSGGINNESIVCLDYLEGGSQPSSDSAEKEAVVLCAGKC